MLKLGNALDAAKEMKAKEAKVSSDDILRLLRTSTADARTKGDKTLNDLANKLNGIEYPMGMSSSLKQYITKMKRDANESYEKERANQVKINNGLDNIEARASNLAVQNADYRKSKAGRQELYDIGSDYAKLMGVENPVSKSYVDDKDPSFVDKFASKFGTDTSAQPGAWKNYLYDPNNEKKVY